MGTSQTTYADLETLSRRFATRFSTLAAPKVLVAFDQGPHAYAAMLGTLLAGGFYAPVNGSAPRAKIRSICKLLQPDVMVGSEEILADLGDIAPQALRVGAADLEATPALSVPVTPNSIAYVIFTSGSTGEPKGVVISHAALTHYLDWVTSCGLFEPGDRTSQYSNIGFDLSVLDIVGALCCGATLYPFVSRGQRLLPAQAIKRHDLTVWISVPSVLSLMMRARQVTRDNLASVRRFFFIGEPLLETHVRALFTACPDAEVWNAYGPTEATVSMTCLRLAASSYAAAVTTSVALGRPIPGMEVQLRGGETGDVGELVILGPQLADGYWNAPEQTARAFRMLDIAGTPRRAYFSGDWVRRVNGHLYFESRIDHQVKIDGFRLELDEVAAAIRSLGWAEVVVRKMDGHITAILENKGGGSAAQVEQELHGPLTQKLERYAVPSRFVVLAEFPRNQNDKIDTAEVERLARTELQQWVIKPTVSGSSPS